MGYVRNMLWFFQRSYSIYSRMAVTLEFCLAVGSASCKDHVNKLCATVRGGPRHKTSQREPKTTPIAAGASVITNMVANPYTAILSCTSTMLVKHFLNCLGLKSTTQNRVHEVDPQGLLVACSGSEP